MNSGDVPNVLKAHRERLAFEIGWPSADPVWLPFHTLRCECPCAACVDEDTGIRTLDIASVPEEIHPIALGYSGNYALKVTWSDGHSTGLFTWPNLARIARDHGTADGKN